MEGMNCLRFGTLLCLFACVHGYAYFRGRIPNGHKVPHPCNPTSDKWVAVGHMLSGGRGPRNPFGDDFAANGNEWTKKLCFMDSDGDGRHNGIELGDPWCQWTKENKYPLQLATSHPGICDPLESPKCEGKNEWLKCPTFSDKCNHATKEPGAHRLDIRLPRLHVPAKENSYICLEYDLPDNDDFHLTAGVPIIDNHITMGGIMVFACEASTYTPASKHPYECGLKTRGDCRHLIGGYSEDIPGICYHKNTGMRIGRTGCRQIVIQIKWNNPEEYEDMFDSSGISLYYTKNLRRYDVGTKIFSSTHFTIPSPRPIYAITSSYPSECSQMQIKSPIYITRAFNHMHKYGKQERVEVIRDGRVVNLITDERFYDLHKPKTFWHTNPVQVLPGDILRITCVYDTREVKHPVHWGLLSTNEICASTIEFYPKGNWMGSTCSSFKSIPLCKLETTGVANGCDFNGFFGALHKDVRTAALFQNCTDMNFCTPACRTLANAATSHPCLTGDSMELLRSPLTAPNKKLKVFFNVLELCGAYTPPKHPQHRRPRKNQNNDTQESMSSGIGGSLPGHLIGPQHKRR